MKAYVLKAVGQLDYEDVPLPVLKSGWVLVKVEAAGICGSDIPRIYETGTYHFPTIPGHEFAGTVVDAYDKEDRLWIGKRVGIFPLIPCKECFVCKEGSYEMCRNYDYLGSRRDGGFAEYAAVPTWNLIELPDEMGRKEAAMLEPASVALHAVRRLQLKPDDSIALYGLGTIGLIITQWLHIFGISKVFAVGHNAAHGKKMQEVATADYLYAQAVRLDRAKGEELYDKLPKNTDESGTAVRSLNGQNNIPVEDTVSWILEKTRGEGVSAAIDCTGTGEGVANCLKCVRPGGEVLVVGNPKGDMTLDQATYWKILRNQIRLSGTWNSSFSHEKEDDWHKVIEACVTGRLHLSELITHCLAFDELKHGLAIVRERKEYQNKIMICAEILSEHGNKPIYK